MPPKIGLVLGGGGSRGLAHIGVLRVLQREKVPFDFIVGTSMGAIVGAFYALDTDINEAEQSMARTMGADLDLPAIIRTIGMLTSTARQRRMREQLTAGFGDKTFADLQIPLYVMAVDMITGQEVTLMSGPLVPALLGSSAVPGVYPPVHLDKMELADGGVIDSLATHVAHRQGADYVIAVDVYPELDLDEPWSDPVSDIMGLQIPVNRFASDLINLFNSDSEKAQSSGEQSGDKPKRRLPSAPAAIWRSVRVVTSHLHQLRLRAAPPDIYMRPAVEHLGSLDFKDVEGPILAGEEEAEQHVNALRLLRDHRLNLERPT